MNTFPIFPRGFNPNPSLPSFTSSSSQDIISSVALLNGHLVISTCAKPQVMCAIINCIRPRSVVSEQWYSLCSTPAKPTYKCFYAGYIFHLSKVTLWRRASLRNFHSVSIRIESWAHLESSGSLEKLLKSGRNEEMISSIFIMVCHILSPTVRWILEACRVSRVLLCFWWSLKEHKYVRLELAARENEKKFLMTMLWEWSREYPR